MLDEILAGGGDCVELCCGLSYELFIQKITCKVSKMYQIQHKTDNKFSALHDIIGPSVDLYILNLSRKHNAHLPHNGTGQKFTSVHVFSCVFNVPLIAKSLKMQ